MSRPRTARTTLPELAPATMSEADGVRYLHLGTPWVQGAMRVRKPQAIELEYVQRMMAWLLLVPTESLADLHSVQLGLGAASITRFCHGVLRQRTTAVEINPTVIEACRLWFHLPMDGPDLAVRCEDAAAFVADPAHAGTAEVLCVDLYDHDAASPVLDSAEFYAACHRLLSAHGVMSVNLFGRDASFEDSAAHIAAAFGPAQVCSLRPTREGNTVVLAWKGGALPDREVLAERAQAVEAAFKLPAKKWLRMLRPSRSDALAAVEEAGSA